MCSRLSRGLAILPLIAATMPGYRASPENRPRTLTPTVQQAPHPLYPETTSERPELPSPSITADGVELLTAYFDDRRVYTLIPVTVERGTSRDYRAGHRGKGDQLDVDARDFPALARNGLHAEAELQATATITGRTIEEITADGRPGAASFAGFLAADEDIISVLTGDNRLVARMGLTHPEMARPLFNVWNILQLHDERMRELDRPLQAVNRFWFGDHEVELISAGYGHGWQTSIFDDENLGMWQIELRRAPRPAEETYLAEHYAHLGEDGVAELTRRLSYLHTGEMVPFYVMRYGFYEGHTRYRADPIAIAFIFGLRTLAELDAAFLGELDIALATHFNEETARNAPTGASPRWHTFESLLPELATGR